MLAAEEQVAGQPLKQGSYTVLEGQFSAAHKIKYGIQFMYARISSKNLH